MERPTQNEVTVKFPATEAFSRLGRVTVGGLAVRLSIDISVIEELRLATDFAIAKLSGPGRITVTAQWEASSMAIRLDNSDVVLDDSDPIQPAEPTPNVDVVVQPPSRIVLTVPPTVPTQDEEE